MITNILDTMFAWPQGIVVGNLIASFLIWFPHFIYITIKHNKLHSKMDALERKIEDAIRNP